MTDGEHRFEVSIFIGPCSNDEAIDLSDRIMDLPEFERVYGGAIGLTRLDDEADA